MRRSERVAFRLSNLYNITFNMTYISEEAHHFSET